MPDPLSTADVHRIARLARLSLTDDQAQAERTRLSAVLGYMERLRELDLTGVEPLASPLDASAPLRADRPGPTLPTDVLMEMAPQTAPPFVKVPKVIGEGA